MPQANFACLAGLGGNLFKGVPSLSSLMQIHLNSSRAAVFI